MTVAVMDNLGVYLQVQVVPLVEHEHGLQEQPDMLMV